MSITGPRPAICESNARTLAEGWVSPLCGTRAAIVEDIECIGRPMADFWPDYARREHAAPQRDSAICNDRTELALAETLSGGDVIGRASDQLHELIEQIVVTWDEDARAHHLDLTGNLVLLLSSGDNKKAA